MASSTRRYDAHVCETHTAAFAQISAQFRKEFLRNVLNSIIHMCNVDSPCLDPACGGTVILGDRRTSASDCRRDSLRACPGITITRSWYANGQIRFGPNIGTVDPRVWRLRSIRQLGRTWSRCSSYQGMLVHIMIILWSSDAPSLSSE